MEYRYYFDNRVNGDGRSGSGSAGHHIFDHVASRRWRPGVMPAGILGRNLPMTLIRCGCALIPALVWAAEPLDTLVFGVPVSEQAHAFSDERSEMVAAGGLGEPARRLLAPATASWSGGRMAFTLAVDPVKPTYATVRFWGGDVTENRLFLFVEGKQIGYRHLGDIDILDVGAPEPACPGRFHYNTTPLPLALTQGKTSIRCEIRSTGRIWGYGRDFAQYQKDMTGPTRGIYRIHTHTDGFFTPPAAEQQGVMPAAAVRTAPGAEVLDKVRERVNGALNGILNGRNPPNQPQTQFLGLAWHEPWTVAAKNPKTLERIVAGADRLYQVFREDPKRVYADPATWNPDWFAAGMVADAVRLVAGELNPFLDQPLDRERNLTRRAAWAALFQDSRDWLRRHRRMYTNQSMIIDLNSYRCNRALAAIAPQQALPEKTALRHLHESIGVEPWLGSDGDQGPTKPMGERYFQTTRRGLTKELGFVGYYGEVLDWVTQIYDATRDPGRPGDPVIKAQLAAMVRARGVFRYPAPDAEGFRAMRIEAVIGWRDDHYPGNVTYGQRPSWDAGPLYTVAAILDADGIGYAQQMLADNQFFAAIAGQMGNGNLRVTMGLLGVPGQYEAVKAQAPSPRRLPMAPGSPDVVFTDEENGVVALKRGDELLYASLYWRARHAVNSLARIHHITPRFDRVAVVREACVVEPGGMTWKRPDWTDFGFARGGHRYPDNPRSAHAGEELPIAPIPAGIAFKPGDESPYAGRASFYTLRYGPYLIGMNTTADRPQRLAWPTGVAQAEDLVSRQMLKPDAQGGVTVAPMSTVVLALGR